MARIKLPPLPPYDDGDAEGAEGGADSGDERGTTILNWAQRLMQTKGYGWSKAVSVARDLYGEEQP